MSKTLDKTELDKLFKAYHEKNTDTATHVFVYSKEQNDRSKHLDFDLEVRHKARRACYVNSKLYSEMRSRDADMEFRFDVDVVAVGTIKDVELRVINNEQRTRRMGFAKLRDS